VTVKERRKCATCPDSTTATLCRWCARQFRRPAGSGVRVPVTLFSGSPEADKRRRAVLDAIDLVPLIDREGWVPFLAWCDRVGYEAPEKNKTPAGPKGTGGFRSSCGAAERQWERLKVRLRSHGIDVEARAPEDFSSVQNAFSMKSMRFTVDGWDRLRALTKALDDWLCSVQEVA